VSTVGGDKCLPAYRSGSLFRLRVIEPTLHFDDAYLSSQEDGMPAHRIFGFNRISAFYAGVIAAPSQLIAEDLVVTALGLVAEPHHPADCAHAARSSI
jgi:hypothetical protein